LIRKVFDRAPSNSAASPIRGECLYDFSMSDGLPLI
jgi:hypothetical protein